MALSKILDADFKIYSLILEPVLREPFYVDRKYNSPIPRNGHYETSASFKVFEAKDGKALLWKDWGLTDQTGHRPVDLIMRLHNVPREEAEKMLETLELPETVNYRRQKKYRLKIEDRPELNYFEKKWWETYNIDEDLLHDYNVYGVDSLWAGEKNIFTANKTDIAFSYRGGPDLSEWQFYRPNPKDFFRKGNFLYGWDQLPMIMDDLVILSGMKDGLCTYQASGLPFLAGSGEGAWAQIEKILPQLQRRAKRIWSLMDPDPPGVIATRAFQTKLNIQPFPFKYINDKLDIAELSKKMGIKWLHQRFVEALARTR